MNNLRHRSVSICHQISSTNGQEKKIAIYKKKNSNFYSIMLRVMSRYKCNHPRCIYYDYLPHK